MRLLAHWIATPAARAVGWTLFHSLWEGAAIAIVLALALLRVREARLRYGAACIGLTAMLVAAAGTFLLLFPGEMASGTAAAFRAAPIGPVPLTGGDGGQHWRAEDLLPWAAPVWLAGVLLLNLRTFASWAAVARLRRSGVVPAPAEWQNRMSALAVSLRLRARVALLESCRVDVPLAVGYLRPAVLVPVGFLTGMPVEAVEAILLHELAHIARRDYFVNLLQTIAGNLLFYHPAAWWMSRVIRQEREHCCDDVVLAVRGDAREYAAALTALELRRAEQPALAATGGDLVKRIHRLLDRPEPRHAALTPALSAGLVILTAAVALAAWQPSAETPQAAASPYEKWVTQDVVYLITPEEQRAFARLSTDEERQHFIEQFWLRRDPTPGTPENEMKEEHYRRIAYANAHFTTPSGVAGWSTDRGRVYILYGPPDELEEHGPTTLDPFPTQSWRYRHIAAVGDGVIVEYQLEASGEYRMRADASVPRGNLWMDSVQLGDLRVMVRGLGELTSTGSVLLRVAETQMKEVRLGQIVTVDFRGAIATGRVARIEGAAVNGTVPVEVQLDAPATGIEAGRGADATILIDTIPGALQVARPMAAQPNSTGVLFRLDPDGRHATRVAVRYGRASVNRIEILSGLSEGDRVIVSDMSARAGYERVELR